MSCLEYINFSVNLIHGSGLSPKSGLFRKIFIYAILSSIDLALYLLVILKFLDMQGDILLIAEGFEAISTMTQGWVRKYILIRYGGLIEEIVNDLNHLWKYDLLTSDIEIYLRSQMRSSLRLIKILVTCCFGTITLMAVSAILDETKSVPLLCWTPDNPILTVIIFICEIIFLLESIYYVASLDSFYLLNCNNLTLQIYMLRKMLQSVHFGIDSDQKILETIIYCSQQHRRLLRLHQKLNQLYSEYFIVQYTITVTAVAIQIYLMLYKSLSIDKIMKNVAYFFTIMFQVALFFIPASNVEIEAEKYSLELYKTNWESNSNIKISKTLLFMLMKSQNSLEMMGAGMIRIGRNEYILVLRLAFSIATILGGLNK